MPCNKHHQQQDNNWNQGESAVVKIWRVVCDFRLFQSRNSIAIFHADLVQMLQIMCKFVSLGIAILRIALERAIEHFLQLRRDRGIGDRRAARMVQQPVVHDLHG